MLAPSEFNEIVDQYLNDIIDTLDEAELDCDAELNQGVLEITCPDRSQIIINRHGPNQEIWIAAKSGGFHFKQKEGNWLDTRSGEPLNLALTRVIAEQTGTTVSFS